MDLRNRWVTGQFRWMGKQKGKQVLVRGNIWTGKQLGEREGHQWGTVGCKL